MKFYMINSCAIYFSIIFVSLIGCNRVEEKIDEFEFKNNTEKDIYVKKLDGFKSSPPVGFLGKGASSSAYMENKGIPKECVVYWSYFEKYEPEAFTQTTVSLIEFKGKKFKGFKFIFNSLGNWEVSSY